MSDLYQLLRQDAPHWANEEEVRKGWLKHIENALGITFHAERGRNDASFNQVIIEFKARLSTHCCSQKMTVAAMQIADMKVWAQRS